MEVTRRRGRRRKKLLDDLKDRRGYSHLKEEALVRTMWRNRFRGGFGPVVRQNTELTNVHKILLRRINIMLGAYIRIIFQNIFRGSAVRTKASNVTPFIPKTQ